MVLEPDGWKNSSTSVRERAGGRAVVVDDDLAFHEKIDWNLFYCDLIIRSESNPLVNPIIWR